MLPVGLALGVVACGGGAEEQPPPELIADPPAGAGFLAGAGLADYDRGVAFVQAGHYAEAVPYFDRVLQVQPDNVLAEYWRAVARERIGDRQGAEEGYQRSLTLDGNLYDAAVSLGKLYLADPPRPANAVVVLTQAVHMRPSDPEIRVLLAHAYRVSGDFLNATIHFRQAIASGGGGHIHYAFGEMLFAGEKYPEAAAQLSLALPQFRSDAAALAAIGKMLQKCSAWESCIEAYSGALALKADEPDWHVRRGICRMGQPDLEAAKEDFRQALKLDKTFAPAHFFLGRALLQQKRKAEAAQELEQAVIYGRGTSIEQKARDEAALLYQSVAP
ncbi:MAG: tetratricopeptide repeat protein [Deltaproteobacteria bacterium]|nr:tetratricopeptide repeat protein [Deltaproteobacteria bacterium]